MEGGEVHVGEKPNQAAGDHHRGRRPIERHHAFGAFAQECQRRRLPRLGQHPHDEAADDEENVDAGRADGEMAAVALGGVEDDHAEGGNRPQILYAVEPGHVAFRNTRRGAGSDCPARCGKASWPAA